ncbi:MAG: transporter [Candidatus Magasanikbacteria bacterium CG10_big_fil_rev_8_21_14_0_10_40_10]|uniref:Probable queuosine precursor transporter n=1 Tax=Candidatus Magasanikbacteria bacterium CG10_big_fil_rev_8_21_14_0_10_40_10 TaxID=1974648 RepID=A0A2M6W3G0_9BACT|nr:MAG: transporter [Candidatus Magasanikbacteria bacterium CG10_big_fil_rev_8_21_14_0_10_40_10]
MKYRYLDIVTAVFVTVLILSNISSVKILSLGWFSFDGGTIIFPLAYIFGDILTEVYGYARARRVIWTGFAMNLLMVLVFWMITALPAAGGWQGQEAFASVVGVVPRIVLASFVAYLCGEFLNSYILAKLKIRTKGRFFWLRAIGSTVVGEFVDTTIFILIAFANVLPNDLLVVLWVSNYIFKILTEVILLPLTYRMVGWLKKKEHEDYYDTDTDFNPLHIKTV